MNIGFGKFGKSIKFNYHSWGLHGGDAAPSILLSAMSQVFPNDTFYVIGRSDIARMKGEMYNEYFPNGNVIDIWEDYYKLAENVEIRPGEKGKDHTFTRRWFEENDVELDVAFFFSGPATNIGIPDKFRKKNKDKTLSDDIYKVLLMGVNYCAPIVDFLNETRIPYLNVCEDPRYFPLGSQDLFHRPAKTLGQYNEERLKTHYVNYEQDEVRSPENVEYANVETIFAIGDEPYDVKDLLSKKLGPDSKFMNVYMNQGLGNGGLDRGPIVEEWILNQWNDDSIKIHGKWKEPWASMSNFTSTAMQDLIEEMEHTKYTLVIPIKKKWVTSKFWKMLHFGILPFMHPYYDTQGNIPVNDFLRVETPQQFKERIQILENDEEFYKELLTETMNTFKDNFYTGKTLITNIYNGMLEIMGKTPDFKFPENIDLKIPVNSFVNSNKQSNKHVPLF